jgi:hypothetical protein
MTIISRAAIVLAGMWLGIGLGTRQYWPELAVAVILCALWQAGQWRGLLWPRNVALFGLGGLAAYANLNGVALIWLLPTVILALAAWDLEHFGQTLASTPDIRDEAGLIRSHTQRLSLIVGLSLLTAVMTLIIKLDLSLWIAILFGLLIVFGFSRTVLFIRRESD